MTAKELKQILGDVPDDWEITINDTSFPAGEVCIETYELRPDERQLMLETGT